jgi:hypothetical protein
MSPGTGWFCWEVYSSGDQATSLSMYVIPPVPTTGPLVILFLSLGRCQPQIQAGSLKCPCVQEHLVTRIHWWLASLMPLPGEVSDMPRSLGPSYSVFTLKNCGPQSRPGPCRVWELERRSRERKKFPSFYLLYCLSFSSYSWKASFQ